MKKFITSLIAISFAMPAFATITNNATCDTTNLGQSENNSTANIEANWNANRINIDWYNGNTRVAQNYCMYNGTITLPTTPTKTGYTFNGWALRNAVNCSGLHTKSSCNSASACVWYDNNTCLDIAQTRTNCLNANGDTCATLPTCTWNSKESECYPWNPPRYCKLLDNLNDCETHAWFCEWDSDAQTCGMASECNQYNNANDCATGCGFYSEDLGRCTEGCTWNSETTRCIYKNEILDGGDMADTPIA